ncbi:MAG: hypothetical protein Q9159_006749 [Coniocarpon cinnabarinum]
MPTSLWRLLGLRRKKNKKKDQPRQDDSAAFEKSKTATATTTTTSTQPSQPYTPSAGDPFSEKSAITPPQRVPPEPVPRESAEYITALPAEAPRDQSPHLFTSPERPPSLHSKRSAAYDPGSARRKLSRKSQTDNNRESQIRSMTAPIPVPKMPGANRRLRDDINNNSSVVSLPHAASFRSSVTAFSDNHYDVGILDVFSPRPTIRYSVQSPLASGGVRSAVTSRTENRPEEESPRRALRESKTIDDLADRYDATTVRELMERDAKRRERRRKAEEDKARRKLERHAARERGEAGPSTRSRRRHRSPRTEMAAHRQREREGLGLTGVDPNVDSARSPQGSRSPGRSRSKGRDDGAQPEEAVKESEDLSKQNPFNDPGSDVDTPVDEPVVKTAEAIRYSTASMSPPTSPGLHERKTSGISQITGLEAGSTTNLAEPSADRRASETSARRAGPFATLLRRNPAPRQGSNEKARGPAFEPSFSNTSRESMKGQLPPAHLRDTPSRGSRSGTPTRTMSKFREDLPEYSPTPPESRGESPVDHPLPPPPSGLGKSRLPESPLQQTTTHTEDPAARNDSMGSTRLLSQSLASVDSEGSWLSGKPAKRSSQQMTPQIISERPDLHGSYENLGITDEEYFKRQATTEPKSGLSGIRAALRGESTESSAVRGPAQDEEKVVRGDVSRKPTVVQQETRRKSTEGLLNQFQEGEAAAGEVGTIESDAKPASPASVGTEGSPGEVEPSTKPVLGHARSVSRGSARLYEIPSRKNSPAVKSGEFEPPSTTEEK